MRRLILTILVLAAAGTCFIAVANAGSNGRHNNSNASTTGPIAVNTAVCPAAADGQYHFGGTVCFNASDPGTDAPVLQVLCWQNGTLVYQARSGDLGKPYVLGPGEPNVFYSTWTGGAASCDVIVGHWLSKFGFAQYSFVTDAQIELPVAA